MTESVGLAVEHGGKIFCDTEEAILGFKGGLGDSAEFECYS